jgi:hypothetical protein
VLILSGQNLTRGPVNGTRKMVVAQLSISLRLRVLSLCGKQAPVTSATESPGTRKD